jgi:hypothetical protein
MELSRRSALKGLGITGIVGGLGIASLSGSAAAMSSSFTAANPGVVSNDRGNISEVYVAPRVFTEWENFDEVPLKLRYVLHAGIDGSGLKPVYRETPWLFSDNTSEQTATDTAEVGTTDRVPASGRNYLLTNNSDFYTIGSGGNANPSPPKIVLYKEGQGTYYDEPSDYPDAGGGTGQDHWDGSSLGNDSGAYANGNYGVLGDTSALDSDTDGAPKTTTVNLRLITALLNYDSESVMQDEYADYSGSAGYTYGRLVNLADNGHPAVNVATASFTVEAQNEQSDSGTTGAANPGAS